jgi:hypothetical protein
MKQVHSGNTATALPSPTMDRVVDALARTLGGRALLMNKVGKRACKDRTSAALSAAVTSSPVVSREDQPLFVVSHRATLRRLLSNLQWYSHEFVNMVIVHNGMIVPVLDRMNDDEYCHTVSNHFLRMDVLADDSAAGTTEMSCDLACDSSGSQSFVGCSRPGCTKMCCAKCFGNYLKVKNPTDIECPFCKKVLLSLYFPSSS